MIFVWYKILTYLFFRFVTMQAFDRETDRQTDGRTDRILIVRPRLHSMRRGKNQCRPYTSRKHSVCYRK